MPSGGLAFSVARLRRAGQTCADNTRPGYNARFPLLSGDAASVQAIKEHPAEDMAYTGWVADEACAKDFAKAGNEEHVGCATGCLSGGGGVALASPDGFHLLDITNEAALEHLGMEVTVMGTLDEATNTIKVTSINASS